MHCYLCKKKDTYLYHSEADREYFRCHMCDLIFVPREFHLSKHDEKLIYDLHENNPEDNSYRVFLNSLATPLMKLLKYGMSGLDFGSGPGPTLDKILSESGFPTTTYDIYYDHHPDRLRKQYDFITCSETVEHFCNPHETWQSLFRLVKPGGYLGIMTLHHDEMTDFNTWWYTKDRTHIMFYSEKTFKYLNTLFQSKIVYLNNRVVIFKLS